MVNGLLVGAPLYYGHDHCSQNKELSYIWLGNVEYYSELIQVTYLCT